MRKRAGSFPPPHIPAINHAEVHWVLYLQSWFWDQSFQFTAVTFNFNSRSVFTLHCNILSWNLSKCTHMTLIYLTLQKGIRILKMTHQRDGWSPVTGNLNEQPLLLLSGVLWKRKYILLLVLFLKWSKAFIASLLAVQGNSIASKQVIIATRKCFLCLGTPVILKKHSFAGSVSVLAFLKSLIMTNNAF